MSKAKLVTCYRCKKLGRRPYRKPAAEFYHREDGSLVQGCKRCHREMQAERRRIAKSAPTPGIAVRALAGADPTAAELFPSLQQYRCEACNRVASVVAGQTPRGWRPLVLFEGEPAVSLCNRCARKLTDASTVVDRARARRLAHNGTGEGLHGAH